MAVATYKIYNDMVLGENQCISVYDALLGVTKYAAW